MEKIPPNDPASGSRLGAWPFVAPFVLVLLAPVIIAWVAPDYPDQVEGPLINSRKSYVAIFGLVSQILIFGATIWLFGSFYRRLSWRRINPLSIVVGLMGTVLWVGLCWLQLEHKLFEMVGAAGLIPERSAINPFEKYTSELAYVFLFFRFCVLVIVIPFVEELFLRGWLVRWFEAAENWDVHPFAAVGIRGAITISIYAVFTHPQESIAAIAWFGLITLWIRRTGNIWDCVLAHAVTNAALGVWILYSGDWRLW